MQDSNVPLPAIGMLNVRLESNADSQKNNAMHEDDNKFERCHRRFKFSSRGNREELMTLLTSQGESAENCIEKLLSEEITYKDLASLTGRDLELMGFSNRQQRDELLSFFVELPNQDLTFDDMCQLPEAKKYNRQILHNAIGHLENMRSALAAANYKLKIMHPADVIVGEKSFASRFVVEALTELRGVTDEIDTELKDLEQLITQDKGVKQRLQSNSNKSILSRRQWLVLSSIAACTLAALLIKYKKSV